MNVNESTSHLVDADALRAAAILLVVMNHLMWWARPTIPGQHALTFGYLGVWGVNCFFVLSGFLLGRSYLSALIDDREFSSTKLYFFRRFLRIYPLYFVAVVASMIMAYLFFEPRPTTMDVVYHFLLMQGLSTATIISLNGPLWTMGIDAAFYLFLPIGALSLRPLLRRRSRRQRIIIIASSLIVVSLACVTFRYAAYSEHREALYDFPTAGVFARNPIGFASSFMIGLAVALVTLTRIRISRAMAISIGIFGVILGLAEFAARLEAGGQPTPLTFVRLSLLDPIAAVSAACVLFGAAQAKSQRLFRLASAKGVAIFASLAYAVYLFHWLVIETLDTWWLHGEVGNAALLKLATATFVIIIPIAYALNRFIEKPFLMIKDRQRGHDASTGATKDASPTIQAVTVNLIRR